MSDCKARFVFDDETSNKSGDMVLALTEKSSVACTKRAKSKKKKLRVKAARANNASDKAQVSTYTGGFVLAANDAISIEVTGSSTAVRADTWRTTSRFL